MTEPPSHWTAWQKFQWYRWDALHELVDELQRGDRDFFPAELD